MTTELPRGTINEVLRYYAEGAPSVIIEAYEVVSIVELIVRDIRLRLEVHKSANVANPVFSVATYEMKDDRWVSISRPWVHEENAEGALNKAVAFLRTDFERA